MKPLKFNTFSIGDTSEMSGVSQKRIRHWESRGYIRCDISLLVYNLYRLGELEKLRLGDKDPASAI
jgi:DNA-binding transcriptional MerR regulator